jgi:hypothetical protein
MADEKQASDELRDATWQWAGRFVMMLVLMGAGYFGGYVQFGDAVELRHENKKLEDTIVDLKNQRETTNTKMARETRDGEVCGKKLKASEQKLKVCTAAAAPAADSE